MLLSNQHLMNSTDLPDTISGDFGQSSISSWELPSTILIVSKDHLSVSSQHVIEKQYCCVKLIEALTILPKFEGISINRFITSPSLNVVWLSSIINELELFKEPFNEIENWNDF